MKNRNTDGKSVTNRWKEHYKQIYRRKKVFGKSPPTQMPKKLEQDSLA
jgi:hypothetical protein